MSVTPETLTAWADKIDNRVGPIPGRDADDLAVLLRAAAKQLAGIPHPTGSEQFQAELTALEAPAPWALAAGRRGKIVSADGAAVLSIDHMDLAYVQYDALALWTVMAINTLAGFRMETKP